MRTGRGDSGPSGAVEDFVFHQDAKLFLRYTQICRQIRRVALFSPRLWRYIDLSHSRFCKEFLTRSKSAPITLIVTSKSGLQVDVETLLPHVNRIHTVNVSLYAEDMLELFSVIQHDTRRISNLRLMLNGIESFPLDYDFSGVRRLSLVGVSVRWDSCANLTQLYLAGTSTLSTIPFSQFRNILVRSPYLEELSLYVPLIMDVNVTQDVIHLPRLRHMVLSTNMPVTPCLLSELDSVPPSAHVSIYDGTDPIGLMHHLPQGICHLAPLRITPTTVLRFHAGKGLYLLSPDVRPWSYDKSTIRFFAPLQTARQVSASYTKEMFGGIPAHFDVSLLTTLELQLYTRIDEVVVLENFLFSIPLLRTLRVDQDSAPSIVAVLGSIQANSSPPCPLLARIEIGVPDSSPNQYRRWQERQWANILSPGYTPPITLIAEGLRKRAASLCHPLHTLKFAGGLDTEAIELLRPHVDKLLITVPRRQ